MTTIFYTQTNLTELVIALNKKIIFVNTNDLQIFKEIKVQDDLTKCGLKQINEDDETKDNKTKVAQESPTIQNVKLAPNGRLLAVTTSGQKALLLYECRPENAKLVSIRPLPRASSSLVFDAESKHLLITDKSGDCYEFDCVNVEQPPKLLLGHLSIVFDVLWTSDGKYIITCDRDDKIRVSNYPETHDIHGYCLGHKEFVAGMALLNDKCLVSVSGDKTLKIWNYESGKELQSIELPAPGIGLHLKEISNGHYEAAVLLYQPNDSVVLFEIKQTSNKLWELKQKSLLCFPGMIVANLCFAQDRLYVVGVLEDRFTIKIAELENTQKSPENWLEMIEQQFKEEEWKLDDISVWFKKKYDNVSDYLERKKRRIEEKQK